MFTSDSLSRCPLYLHDLYSVLLLGDKHTTDLMITYLCGYINHNDEILSSHPRPSFRRYSLTPIFAAIEQASHSMISTTL